jgi:membrane protease YdiL (CAAX protease family)
VAAAAGLAVFAAFSHRSAPLSLIALGGFALAAAAILWSGFGAARPAALLGLDSLTKRAAAFSALGVALGLGAGIWHRYALDLSLWPGPGIEAFVVIACLIGATEEIIYRGWILGRARALGSAAAVLIAALAHTAYKTALFVLPSEAAPVDLMQVAFVTFLGGIVLGVLRVASRNLMPALLAHVAFDFVVYGAVAAAPWWVWN